MSRLKLSFTSLRFSYGAQEVLHGVSSQISPGEITALFGPNGSGKTTLLKCLAGLLRPDQGDICINESSILKLSPRERGKLVCYVPQEHGVSFGYTVEEVVLMGRTPHLGGMQGPQKKDYVLAKDAMKAIGIESIAHRPYTELSGGQRQLVLIARALAQGCDIMILDEPTSALDFRNQLTVWNTLRELKNTGKTILVCTHDPNHVMWFCDNVIALRDGTIFTSGAVSECMDAPLMGELYGPVCEVRDRVVVPSF